MVAEAGHEANRSYQDQSGNYHLNGGSFFNDAEEDLSDLLDLPQVRVKRIAITATPTGAEQDTTWDLPAKAVLLDVLVDVTTAEATGGTKTIDVGLKAGEAGGDADGFIDGLSVAATGIKRGQVALDGGGAYFDTCTRGVLLRKFVQGAGADDRGLYAELPHMAAAVTAKSVVYTAGSNDFAEFRGSLILVYLQLP